MSEVQKMLQNYKEVRERLRHPPNAVPDTGINLKRARTKPQQPVQLKELPSPAKIDASPPPIKFIPILTISSTLAMAAKELGIRTEDLKSKCRIRAVTLPRQIAIYIVTRQNRWPCAWIGRHLDMDHTTILYARNKIAAMIEADPAIRECVEAIEAKIAALYSLTVPSDNQPHMGEEQEGNVSIPELSHMDIGG